MKNTKLGLILMDVLCAGMLAAGAAAVVLPAAGVVISPILLAVSILLLLGVFALSERRPWVPVAVLAAVVLIVLAVAALMGKASALGAALSSYARQAWEDAADSPQPLVCLICTFPIALVFWAIVRLGNRFRLVALWMVSILCGGLIGYKAICIPEGWLAPFLLLCAGLILFLPRATLGKEGRLQAQVLAAILALPVLGLAVLLGPRDNGQWRSASVGYLVQDAQDFWEYHWGDLPPLPVTSMRSMGLQPQRDRLGGDWETGDTPALTGSQNLLLRGQVLEFYTGSGWEDSAGEKPGNFRFESLFWQGRRGDAFGLKLPKEVSVPLLDELLTDVNADLRTLRNFRTLFLPYRPKDVETTHGGSSLFFNMQGEAYWNSPPKSSVEYHIEGRTWNFRDKGFDRNMLYLEKELAYLGEDKSWDQAAANCLQLPETLPGWVSGLALELTADSRSPYAKAIALRDWLSENCTYTLTPGPTDPEQDFVAEFLTERQGYCTYYASALTVLCRCAGIPARYATGYGMVKDGKRYKATQATAHAWTEIYLGYIGWVPLDALDQDIFQPDAPPPEESQAGGAAMGPPATPAPTPGEIGGLWEVEPEDTGFDPMILLWLAPVVLVAAAFLVTKRLRSRRYRPDYVRRKFPQPGPAAEHCYAGLLRLLRMMELRPQPGETLLAFWQRAAQLLPEDVDWQEAGRIMDRLRFGDVPPDGSDIRFLCGCYGALEKHIRETQGLLKRLRV